MKIAITCPASIPATQFGGIMFLCIHIAKKLSNDGHQVTIYTTDLDFANNTSTFNKKLLREEKFGNFLIKRTHVWFSSFLFFVNPGMYKQMMNDEFDVIHAVGIRGFQAFIAAIISKRKNIPLIISDQGGLTTHPDLQKASLKKKFLIKLQQPMIKFIIKQATQIIVPNLYEKKIFLEFSNESKITIIPNGVDLTDLQSSKINFSKKYRINQSFILFLGRFHTVKGVDTLIESVHLIKNNLISKGIMVVIMGVDFGFELKMEQMIHKLQLSDIILVIKKPPRDDVIAAYHECKFLVLPSRWELSPLTPLEGFACSKTVISTDAHGIPHTIKHNENCLLVPTSNPKSLGNAILELLNDPSKCDRLAKSGYDFVFREGNLEKMADSIFLVYDKTIQLKNQKSEEA